MSERPHPSRLTYPQHRRLLDKCGNTTFSEDGTSGTLTFSKLSGIEGDRGTAGGFAETEFVQLASAANDKVSAEL